MAIFVTESDAALTQEQVKFCYGMSKMTVVVDSLTANFQSMEFVEFLELICRAADVKFRRTEIESEELHLKVGYILDDILPLLGPGYEREEVGDQVVEISESDEDY